MTRYGYVRVSTVEQNEQRQIKKMLELGISAKNIFVDKASGKNLDRNAYKSLMQVITVGDEIVLDSLDRLGRDYDDVTREWKRLTVDEGVDIRVLDLEFFDSAKFREMGSVGKCVQDMLLSLLAYVAQTEREKNRQRQAEGIALAKAAGKYKGSTKKQFPSELIARAEEALRSKGKSAAARVLGCSNNTIYAMLADGRLKEGDSNAA